MRSVILTLILFSLIPLSYAQENSTDAIVSKLIDHEKLIERIVTNEANLQNNKENLKELRDNMNIELFGIRTESTQQFQITLIFTVLSVFLSGYFGWIIHKREFNAELSKLHLTNIKQDILKPLGGFSKTLQHQISPENEQWIFVPSTKDIVKVRSLDLSNIQNYEEWKQTGDFNSQLFKDLIENHYPSISKKLDSAKKLADTYNLNRAKIISQIQLKLNKFTAYDYEFVDDVSSVPESKQEIEGHPRHSCNTYNFAHVIYRLRFNKIRKEDVTITRHHDGIIAIGCAPVDYSRVVYPANEGDEKDEKFVLDCLNYVYVDEQITKLIEDNYNIFLKLQTQIDDFKLEIEEKFNKMILNTKKRFFILSSCPYTKE